MALTPKEYANGVRAMIRAFRDNISSEQLKHYLETHKRYNGYNALLIAMQNPDATDCRSYDDWLTVGRQVKRGEHGIRVFYRSTDDFDTVFDVTQTYEREVTR